MSKRKLLYKYCVGQKKTQVWNGNEWEDCPFCEQCHTLKTDTPAPDTFPTISSVKPPSADVDYKVFNSAEILEAAKAFRERVKSIEDRVEDLDRATAFGLHDHRKQLDELYKRIAKLERRRK